MIETERYVKIEEENLDAPAETRTRSLGMGSRDFTLKPLALLHWITDNSYIYYGINIFFNFWDRRISATTIIHCPTPPPFLVKKKRKNQKS